MPNLIFLIIPVFIILFVYGMIRARKRREAMAAIAERHGFAFEPAKCRSIADQYGFLDKLRSGHSRYAYNIMSGDYKGRDIILFDYHYTTGSGKNRTNHNISCFILRMEKSFPELVICKEGLLSKIAQAAGYDDIDFESHEFSRKFCVRSKNKKFAYDVCNSRMIEYLLENPDLTIEIQFDILAMTFRRRLRPERIGPNLDRLVHIRSLMPEYLFDGS